MSNINTVGFWFTTFSRVDNKNYRYPIIPYGENGARAIHHFIDLGLTKEQQDQNNIVLAKTFPDWADYLETKEHPRSVLLYLKRTTPIIGWFIPNRGLVNRDNSFLDETKRNMENKTEKKYEW